MDMPCLIFAFHASSIIIDSYVHRLNWATISLVTFTLSRASCISPMKASHGTNSVLFSCLLADSTQGILRKMFEAVKSDQG